MKKISQILLIMIAASTLLTACGEQGVGPSKPKATATKAAE